MNINMYNNKNDIFHDSNKCKTEKKTTSITVETCRLQLKQELPELFHKILSINEEYCCQQINFTCK